MGASETYKLAKIHDNALIIDSEIDFESVVVYKGARIQNSTLDSHVIVGDDSIVFNSTLSSKSSVARRNVISNTILGQGSSTQNNTTIRFAKVGKFCAIAWNVTIGAPNHDMHRLAMAELDYVFEGENKEHLTSFDTLPCTIGNDVWVAAGAHVLRDVQVSDGAVIAANAVITKDVPPYAIVAGVPGKIIGYRFSDRMIEKLLRLQWWNFNKNQLDIARPLFNGDLTEDKLDKLFAIKEA